MRIAAKQTRPAKRIAKKTYQRNSRWDGCVSIRKSKQGYLIKWIRISLKHWEPYHIYLWEKSYGPIPRYRLVYFKDGNTLNCKMDNLILLTKKQRIELNRRIRRKRKLNAQKADKTRIAIAEIDKLLEYYENSPLQESMVTDDIAQLKQRKAKLQKKLKINRQPLFPCKEYV